MSTGTVMVQGVEMTKAAAECVRETGTDVDDDIAALRRGDYTPETFLAYCLDQADEDRTRGWEEYVGAVVAAAEECP